MSAIKIQLGIFSDQKQRYDFLHQHDPFFLDLNYLKKNDVSLGIVLIDEQTFLQVEAVRTLTHLKTIGAIYKLVYVGLNDSELPSDLLAELSIDLYRSLSQVSDGFINELLLDLQQAAQDEAYFNLSSELNEQYETLKKELESKLGEKTRNLIESRKQIFEINNRVEILRKSLFAVSKVHRLEEAEQLLNDILVRSGIITWLKIVPGVDSDHLRLELESRFESTFVDFSIVIANNYHSVYFFKGDRRAFKKTDLNLFQKIIETLQGNLNRHLNTLSLQQSERLFDLAFHSFPHPILIIDSQYQIYQANLAAERFSEDAQENTTCYKLLFNRQAPCVGCHLGKAFQIQNETKTFWVQSSKFKHNEGSRSGYWLQFYEDISERRLLESKFQQMARLSELGLIASSIAHELNNPLGGILSYLQIMKIETPDTHPFQKDLEFLTEAADRMKKHIENLLYFSRKEDVAKIESLSLDNLFQKNLDLMQMQLKKEHLIVSFQSSTQSITQDLSELHFRNMLHLVFQFFQNKLKIKKQQKSNLSGLVEVKISQDQMNSYLVLNANLGTHDLSQSSNDLSLITLEKSVLDQGFQLVISEPQPQWIQLLITMPRQKIS